MQHAVKLSHSYVRRHRQAGCLLVKTTREYETYDSNQISEQRARLKPKSIVPGLVFHHRATGAGNYTSVVHNLTSQHLLNN